jgi:hypothetical protein
MSVITLTVHTVVLRVSTPRSLIGVTNVLKQRAGSIDNVELCVVTYEGLCVTNTNGFWIACLDLLTLLLQFLLAIINYNTLQSMTA